jgi:archaellum biogenesis ATPase FlaH
MAVKEFTVELEQLFLEMMIADSEAYVRVQNIFNPENFSRSLKEIASFVQLYVENYKGMPTIEQINATLGSKLKPMVLLDDPESQLNWFLEEFEGFSQSREIERAILKAADLLEKGDRAPIEKLIRDAVQVGLVKDIGTDYFKDPRARLMAIKEGNGQVSSGWPALDKALYGGFNRGELNVWAANSGGGKSLFLMNIAINWVTSGLNGIYLSLELSEGLCSLRADAMMSNMGTKDVFKNMDDVELKLGMAQKKSGKFQIKYMPAQSTINDIRAFIKEYQVQTGTKVDFVVIDYLDLLMPVSAKVSPNDLFVKDKYVSEEIRNFAKELNILCQTASQLNRSAVDEVEFDHSNISGGISKINTADNVFGIFTSRAMRERGKFQVQFLKTRSSSGVGQKVDLDFDVNSLRITDSGDSDGSENAASPTLANDILGKIKVKSSVTSEVAVPKAEVNSVRLKEMLAGLTASKK